MNSPSKWWGVFFFIVGGVLMDFAVGLGIVGLNPYAAVLVFWFGLLSFVFSCFSFIRYGERKGGGFS